MPQSLEELAGFAMIGFDRETPFIRRLLERFPAFPCERRAFRPDSDLAQLGAIRAGFGIGVCQSALAARDPRLVRVLRGEFSVQMDTWVAMHEDLRASARCAATFAAQVAGLRGYAEGA
ncbi:hypothetical protein Tamer19_20230 [Cupriavidus sp. TA19]|nr:hypothetical protein CTP10_R41820 [Cupriavidus sp. P-10]GLC92615.1 hypothetical protein Tamer19_20230 [Cupriavidus sp. TA19]